MERVAAPSFKAYLLLTKPGIIFGNLLSAFGGFALAARGHYDFTLLTATLLGLSGIIASACVLNNYIDRQMDQKMERTQHRALAAGTISILKALFFSLCLGATGSCLLAVGTNLLAISLALLGLAVYVFWYSFAKYRTEHATLIGSIAGAIPPVVGYCAVRDVLDLGALLWFALMVCWQMPHFYAIAIYRGKDYAAASIPVLPLKRGMRTTKIHMLAYVAAFTGVSSLLSIWGYTDKLYLIFSLGIGAVWLWLGFRGLSSQDDRRWARQMFLFSLMVVLVIAVLMPFTTL